MKYISLLGATGSIGTQTLDIIRMNPDKFVLTAMSAGKNLGLTRKFIKEFTPEFVSVQSKEDCESLRREFAGEEIAFSYSEEGLVEAACHEKTDIVVNAVLGSVGLYPTLQAIEAGKDIAIANKETLVTAGHLVMKAANDAGVRLLPVDSEHSAIFQALQGEQEKSIENLIITASGGSFRDRTRDELEGVTVEDALNHPNWSMGAKITIDSATMMNKGLEVIEAHWLFGLPYDQIKVLQHRESIIHSMIEFHDSSIIAQLGTPDMRVPIQYALTYPERIPFPKANRLNLAEIGRLNFKEMDFERFPCLRYAYEAGVAGGTMTTVLNAANEEAVSRFLSGHADFLDIERMIEKALKRHSKTENPGLDLIREVDTETREFVRSI
ncbi:1-deoxy-D-xylulose-5-phosphate reductoisomerase [Peribacillus kribbensis]|uniref:1-deoxy-D-xylulose-5-phosphate reductoisomerase n=1 Tax=Peribacillus kribbensis TaxID=356658 RepID=UPI00040CE0A1|nr:1-deoxy-D-xylulose-5-phosphate reductoisomerase [Peribacillus kribbensis]